MYASYLTFWYTEVNGFYVISSSYSGLLPYVFMLFGVSWKDKTLKLLGCNYYYIVIFKVF